MYDTLKLDASFGLVAIQNFNHILKEFLKV